MRRVIYSLYVDVPAKEHYGQSKNKYDTTEKASITVNAFKKHYDKLIDTKKSYANLIGADFKMFEYDKQYETFEKNFKSDFPELTGYEIINFYKIHLLYELAKNYDEILLLGSGKGVTSVRTISEIKWKRKNLKKFKFLSKQYEAVINKCNSYRF